MRPGHHLKLSIIAPEGEEGYLVTLVASSPDTTVAMSETHKVEWFGQAVQAAQRMLDEFSRRAGCS
jgi:hypothetical protein